MDNQELRIEVLLEEVVKKRASDLHLQLGLPPMLRVDGSLAPIPGYNPLDEPAVESLILLFLTRISSRSSPRTRSSTLALPLGHSDDFA